MLIKLLKSLFVKFFKRKKLIIITRKGYNIVLPFKIYMQIINDGCRIDLTLYKGKPSCVQINKQVGKKLKYICTLKSLMNVKSFRDHNICNFSYNNIIVKDKNK